MSTGISWPDIKLGLGMAVAIAISVGFFSFIPSYLYPTLPLEEGERIVALEDRGWIAAEWGASAEGRRVKFYSLTPEGKRQFAEERASWKLFAGAVEQILQAT